MCSGAALELSDVYTYLLGMYLGDGCISLAPRTTALRIACADSYEAIMKEAPTRCTTSRAAPLPPAEAGVRDAYYAMEALALFVPPACPGRKHDRLILLADWQSEVVARYPKPLIRGLIHSDGCRATNTIHQALPSGVKTYRYPRYFFSNESADILGIFTDALDLLGIAWRQNRYNSISVARREAVAALDAFVGPKA